MNLSRSESGEIKFPSRGKSKESVTDVEQNHKNKEMKRTINVAIGGCSFTIDEDAYNTLNDYLERFKAALDSSSASAGVMDELEVRIADQLKGKLGGRQVVDLGMTQEVIGRLGYPEGYKAPEEQTGNYETPKDDYHYSGYDGEKPVRKLFRDPDGKRIAGVCSGLALFLGVDVVLIRVIFLIALICGSAGFWIYLVIWIAAPEARTAGEKCELRGIPATAENIRRFTTGI
jgi:phage shock protein PspC (stress-responsive transcriptional regulator)